MPTALKRNLKHKNNKFSKLKWVGISAFTLVLLTLVLAIYLNLHWKKVLSLRIKEAITISTDSLYHVNFKNIQINILTGNVIIKGISFFPDINIYKQLKIKNIAPSHLYSIQVAELNLRKVHPLKIYFNRHLKIQSIIIDKPIIQVWFSNNITKGPLIDRQSTYQRLSKYLKSIAVSEVLFKEVDFKYIDRSSKKNATSGLKNLSIKISDLLIDSLSQKDTSRFFHTKDIFVELKNYELTTNDNLYKLYIKKFTASTANGYARIQGLNLEPQYPEMIFSQKFKVQKNRYSISSSEILLNKINYKLLTRERKLNASHLLINNAKLNVFLNRSFPALGLDRANNYPQVILKKFKLPISLDSVTIKNGDIAYSEYNPLSQQKGTVTFKNTNGRLLNLTNEPSGLLKNQYCTADFSSLLMNQGRINARVIFNLSDKESSFSYVGNLGLMNALKLNPVMKPLTLVAIKSGTITKVNFIGRGNIHQNRGNIEFLYKGLNIALLKKDTSRLKLKKQSLSSIMANAIIVKNDNPLIGKTVRKASFNIKRPTNASFFNLMWKGIFSGIMETIGFGEIIQKEMNIRIKQLKIEKSERIIRREGRKLKRYNRRAKKNTINN